MEYRIIDVQPGAGDNDVLFTVAYWYGDFDRGLGKDPDFIEEHLIENFPVDRRVPVLDEMGNYIDLDGYAVHPFVETPEGWVPLVPDLDQVQTVELPSAEETLVADIEATMHEKERDRPSGESRPWGTNPKYKKSKKAKHFAKNAKLQGLKGKSKRVKK